MCLESCEKQSFDWVGEKPAALNISLGGGAAALPQRACLVQLSHCSGPVRHTTIREQCQLQAQMQRAEAGRTTARGKDMPWIVPRPIHRETLSSEAALQAPPSRWRPLPKPTCRKERASLAREGLFGGRRGMMPPPRVHWLQPCRVGPSRLAIGCKINYLHMGRGNWTRLGPALGVSVATAATEVDQELAMALRRGRR